MAPMSDCCLLRAGEMVKTSAWTENTTPTRSNNTSVLILRVDLGSMIEFATEIHVIYYVMRILC